ncbi:electron transfer flavoprotein subunit beta/FixA family protein [Paenibacillus sp.]|uniref:electron transfer flavoprotein subunit beta/FixA family protein n=1 Tax=Paenibacillus sp. TaxID=58172 RepID=UPI002D2E33B6|nr:electron transfer flavoprotein subunit beta/FixA family protein [Paenibacillus sp.]HZG88354.1 electron transfer flavoprotein subunit beta/FixA family protein [Paenibacillus sp.]
MNIVVFVKQTFDTEERIVLAGNGVSEEGVKFVVNPYDEYAIEQGIRLRDEAGGGKVTVVSVGPARAAEALRTALAMGADEAALVDDARIPADEYAVSIALAAAARHVAGGTPDVVLGGNFSVDNGAGQVAIRVAELLGMPHVAAVTALTISGGVASAERDAEGDAELVEVPLPALFTAQQGLNEPRYPSLPGIMKAKKKPLATLALDDLGLTPEDVAAKTVRVGLDLPPPRAAGRLIAGDPAAQAAELARLLREEAKVL